MIGFSFLKYKDGFKNLYNSSNSIIFQQIYTEKEQPLPSKGRKTSWSDGGWCFMEIYAILHLHPSTHTTVRVSFATGASEKATSVSFARPAALGHSSLHGRGNDSILICFYFSRKKNSWEANCVHTALSLGSVEVCVPSAGNIHLISHSHEHCHEITFPDHGTQKCRYMGGDVI